MNVHPSAYNVVLSFGKYKDFSLGYVFERHRGYLDWLIGNEAVPDRWRIAAAKTLMGEAIPDLNLPAKPIPTINVWKPTFSKAEDSEWVVVRFPFDQELLTRFKETIDGRRWNKDIGAWEFPAVHLPKAVELFGGTANVVADDEVKAAYRKEKSRRIQLDEIRVKSDNDLIINTLLPLIDYQKVAVEFIDAAGGRAIDADQMGLGKTATGLGFLVFKGAFTLIIVPKKVKEQWRRETLRFTGIEACVWESDGPIGNLESQVHLIHYDIVKNHIDALIKLKFDLLICDEATYLKNYKSQRSKIILGNWKERKLYPGLKTKWLLFLTGTPILNRPIEMFNMLSAIDKKRFNNPKLFINRYGGSSGIPPQNLQELFDRTRDVLIRRLKKQVEKELKPLERYDLVVDMEPKEAALYEKEFLRLVKRWGQARRPSASQMPEIRNLLFDIKFPRIIEFIDEMVDSGRPILVFTIQVEHAERIAKHYGERARVITGKVSAKKTQQAIDDAVNAKVDILVITIGSGAMGLDTLQRRFDAVLFADQWFVPTIHEQAEGRVHRKGQTNQVQVWYLIVKDTFDEYMKEILFEKMKMIDAAVEGEVLEQARNHSIFKELVRMINKRRKLALQDPDEELELIT